MNRRHALLAALAAPLAALPPIHQDNGWEPTCFRKTAGNFMVYVSRNTCWGEADSWACYLHVRDGQCSLPMLVMVTRAPDRATAMADAEEWLKRNAKE